MKRKPKRMKPVAHDVPTAPPTAPVPEGKQPIVFSANVALPPGIAGSPIGRFLPAGAESPFRSISEVPPNLLPFIVQSSDRPDPEQDHGPQSLTYTLGTNYDIDSRGFRRSRVGREFINLQQQAETERAWERALSEPSESERQAMEIVQQDFEAGVARDRAEAESRAKEAEMAVEPREGIRQRRPKRRRRLDGFPIHIHRTNL